MPAEQSQLAQLSQLRGLHLPPEAGFWPLAPGWWLLLGVAVLLLLASFLAGRRYLQHRRRQRYRRQALSLLQQLYQRWQQPAADAEKLDKREYLQQLNAVLKRVALTAYPQADTAALYGEPWCRFLRDSAGLPAFTEGVGQALASGPYQPQPEVDVAALQQLAEDWIRQHRATFTPAPLASVATEKLETEAEQQSSRARRGGRPC